MNAQADSSMYRYKNPEAMYFPSGAIRSIYLAPGIETEFFFQNNFESHLTHTLSNFSDKGVCRDLPFNIDASRDNKVRSLVYRMAQPIEPEIHRKKIK